MVENWKIIGWRRRGVCVYTCLCKCIARFTRAKNNFPRDLLIEITCSAGDRLRYLNAKREPASTGSQIFLTAIMRVREIWAIPSFSFKSNSPAEIPQLTRIWSDIHERSHPFVAGFVPKGIRPISSGRAFTSRRKIAPIIFYAMRHISQFNPDGTAPSKGERESNRLARITSREIFHAENKLRESDAIA